MMRNESTFMVRLFAALLGTILILSPLCATGDVSSAMDWLSAQQTSDGSFVGAVETAGEFKASAETLRVLRDQGALETSTVDLALASSYLVNSSSDITANLTERLRVADLTGESPPSLVDALIARQANANGFPPIPGFDASVLDTAETLLALKTTDTESAASIAAALSYLQGTQNPDGGFSLGAANASSVYVTGIVIETLAGYRNAYPDLKAVISDARAFLESEIGDGAFSEEDFINAQALVALASISAETPTLYSNVIDSLRSNQRQDGSWSGDVYTTALAVRALTAVEALGTGSEAASAVTGRFVFEGTEEPVSGVSVSVAGVDGHSVTADTTGSFRLAGLSEGGYTLVAERSGFVSRGLTVFVSHGQIKNLGAIALAPLEDHGVLGFDVKDQGTGAPLDDASISLTGPATATFSTTGSGQADSPGIPAGTYEFTVEAGGYHGTSGQVFVPGGAHKHVLVAMVGENTPLEDGAAPLYGQVVNGNTGEPIFGAELVLAADGLVETSDSDGRFRFASVERGVHAISLSAGGYSSTEVSVAFPAGAGGDLGQLPLFPQSGTTAPKTLTLHLEVADQLSGSPIQNAQVSIPEFDVNAVTNAEGHVVLSDISSLSFSLEISATGYKSITGTVSATAWGEHYESIAIEPAGDPGADSLTVVGTITDSDTGEPIAGVLVSANSGASTTSEGNGTYELAGMETKELDLVFSADGYRSKTFPISVTEFGRYKLDAALIPFGELQATVDQVDAPTSPIGPDSVAMINADLTNRGSDPIAVLVMGEIRNSEGASVASFSPADPTTGIIKSEFQLTVGETISVTLPWSVHQTAPGTYTVVVRLVEPESISRSNPKGTQIHEGASRVSVLPVAKFTGQLDLSPPLVQAGSELPVKLGALLRNIGNIALQPAEYLLELVDPASSSVLLTRTTNADVISPSGVVPLDFGTWIPDAAGDFNVRVTSMGHPEAGAVNGSLYVGNMATGTFTVAPEEVPEGTQTVQGRVELSGVDVTNGISTDPLFDLVRKAVTDGAEFVAPSAVQWHKRNRCLGCHIQTQSAFGLISSLDKGDVDKELTEELENYIVSSQQPDGGLRMSHPWHTKNQTALGLWALSVSSHQEELFNTELKALRHLYERRYHRDGITSWTPDHNTGWLRNQEAITAITVQSLNRVLANEEELEAKSDPDYKWGESISVEASNDLELYDATVFNERLYVVGRGGLVVEVDPEISRAEILPDTGSAGGRGRSIAVDDEGTLYIVGDFPKLIRISADGDREVIPLPRGHDYYGVAVDDRGRVYLAREDSTLMRMATDGGISIVHAGAPLATPRDLEFSADGSLLIANWADFNILKWREDEGLSKFQEGLAYRPVNLHPNADGSVFVTNGRYSRAGEWTDSGLMRITPSGVVQRLIEKTRFFGVVVHGGEIYAPFFNRNRIDKLREVPPDSQILDTFRAEIPRITRFALRRAHNNNNENLLNAFRLIILAEGREFASEPTVRAEIDEATSHLEGLLRQRQEADGGWSRYASWERSDPLTTAWVGLALEYTNPSVDDPVVRNAIEFLLSKQQGDGAWPNIHGYFGTRLASTSLVMAYLPKALERLGGLDVQLGIDFPAGIAASSFSRLPSLETETPQGDSSFQWDLQGVTASGQDIDFDLTLHEMELFEERSAAKSATLTFKNSFTDETITTPIDIPVIRAVSSVSLDGSTDRPLYGAEEPVQIAAAVTNAGPEFAGGKLHYTIMTSESAQVVAELDGRSVPPLAHGEQIELPSEWNTGTNPATDYLVRLRLYDSQGRLRARKDLPFAIDVTGTLVESEIWTDRPVYQAWDEVELTSRVSNGSVNGHLPGTLARVSVADPEGTTVLEESIAVRELSPGAYRDFPDDLTLTDAPAGEYQARVRVFDAEGETLLTESGTTFLVERSALQAITGDVSVSASRVHQGDSINCMETVTNQSSGLDVEFTAVSELVFISGEKIVDVEERGLQLPAGGADSRDRDITTDNLELGGYACRLLARKEDGSQKLLDYDLFTVLEPPIDIEASFSRPVGVGRVLVLLDRPGRFVSDDFCTGVDELRLEHDLPLALPEGTEVEARLLDAAGSELDQETASLEAGAVDRSPGDVVNLSVESLNASRLSVTLEGPHLSDGAYRVTATVSRADGQATELDSGLIEPACGLEDRLGQPLGDFALAAVHAVPRVDTDEPFGPLTAGPLSAQRRWLQTVLDDAGWSYTIVESTDAFMAELRTGAYRAYALFSERIKLATDFQKEIREAVYRGEGLLVGGPHDERNHFVFEPLGVKQRGKHSDVDTLLVENSPLQDSFRVPLRLGERPERISLEGALVAARFQTANGSGGFDVAETYYPFGRGVGIYGAFDLLVQGQEDGTTGPYSELLLNALTYAYPVTGPEAGHPVPVTLTLANQGIAVDGRVLFTVPADVTVLDANDTLEMVAGAPSWPFQLAEEATRELTVWLSAPLAPAELQARIQVLMDEAFKDHETVSTIVASGAVVDPETISVSLNELAAQYRPLKHIVRDFERGLAEFEEGDYAVALDIWIKLADRIQQHAAPTDALDARVGLARMIRLAEMRL